MLAFVQDFIVAKAFIELLFNREVASFSPYRKFYRQARTNPLFIGRHLSFVEHPATDFIFQKMVKNEKSSESPTQPENVRFLTVFL